MHTSTARALAVATFAVSVTLCLGAAVLTAVTWAVPVLPTEFGPKGYAIVFSLVYGGVGALIAARHPSNAIGWIFCGAGILSAAMGFAGEYARWALIAEGRTAGAGLVAAWALEWFWIPLIGSLGLVAAIFPDGRFLSRGWKRATLVAIGLALVPIVSNALIPRFTIYEGFENPFGVGGSGMVNFSQASIGLLLPLLCIGAAAAIVRFRRAHGDERLQLKWLVLAASAIAIAIAFYGLVVILVGVGSDDPSSTDWAEYVAIATFMSVPISIAFGVLKYRLYDIDIVINRAAVYAGLAAFITAVYVGIVVGIGALVGSGGNVLLSAIAAAVVALAFQPARRRAQHLANRLVYGDRATPYEVLSDLSERFAAAYSLDDVLPRLARVTGEAVGATRTRVWLRSGDRIHVAAAWPEDGASPDEILVTGDDVPGLPDPHVFPVRHGDRLLGAVSVTMPAAEPLGPSQEKLLGDVAAQAALVLRNVALVEDLRASRKRIVSAQDERAKQLERNIHDGAQQQLVSLGIKIRLARGVLGKDPAGAEALLSQLETETQETLEDLRDLARGIYPPLLADKGLVDAIESQARKSSVPVRIETSGLSRYPPDVESAVYFSVLEALQNIAKYAGPTEAEVRLQQHDGLLRFEIEDRGAGFDPATAPPGAGLQNMSDRLAAIGGELEVRSALGHGTTVSGVVRVGTDASSS